MTQGQKIIKYLAIALAVFLIINIIAAIIWALGIFGGILGLYQEQPVASENMEVLHKEGENVISLNIELNVTNLEIKRGDTFQVETNQSNINYKNKNGVVTIKEKDHFWNSITGDNDRLLVIYLPEHHSLQEVEIESGSGLVTISDLETERLDIDQGAGKVVLDNLNVTGTTSIDGGAGKLEVISGIFHNLDLDLGIGEFDFKGQLTGNNEIDAGIGSVKMAFTNDISNYHIIAEKRIGSIKVSGEELENEKPYGDGPHHLRISGGIGSITLN